MSSMILMPLLGILLAVQDLPTGPVVGDDPGGRIHDYLCNLQRFGFSGAVLIAKDGELILSHGYGLARREDGVPFTPETVLSCGSITKQFTAAAVVLLAQDDLLSLDDTLDLHLDDVPADKRDLTIHQLLTHTAGLGNQGPGSHPDRDSFVHDLLATSLRYPPGQRFHYSNDGYNLLAVLVEQVSEMPFEEFLREELLLPSGMQHTGVDLPSWRPHHIALGYRGDAKFGAMLEEPIGRRVGHGLAGSGGIHSTILDMYRWHLALSGEDLLSSESKERMYTPGVATGREGYGYGWGIRETPWGTRLINHDGSNDIFSADFRRYVDDDVVLYAIGNDANFYVFDVTPQIENLIFDRPFDAPPTVVDRSEEQLTTYAGTYRLDNGGTVRVRAKGNSLRLYSSDPAGAAALFPIPAGQTVRRQQELLGQVEEMHEAISTGDHSLYHRWIQPQAPLEAVSRRLAAQWQSLLQAHGEFQSVQAIPGQCRFGEIAILAVLTFALGEQLIEYSFGDQEVGSISFLEERPQRPVHPESKESFVHYVPEGHQVWRVRFEWEGDGAPARLRFGADRDGPVAVRVD